MFNVKDYGAAGGGTSLCTGAIQRAIDDCAKAGGGKVYIPAGCYLTGTLFLRSHCELHLEQGAELRGSTNIADYKKLPDSLYWYNMFRYGIYGLILADGICDAGISGRGTINGQGTSGGHFPNPGDPEGIRPFLIVYRNSRDMYLEDIKIKEPSVFSFYGIHCDNIRISGVEIRSFGCTNGDGLDFDGSRNVRISNCILETGDDSISLKTLDPAYPCENYVISDCIMRSRWAAVRMGPESSADIRNCSVTNCVFQDCEDGLKIQTNSGGIFEDLVFSNITMRDVRRPVLMTQNYFRMGSKDPGIRPTSGIIRRIHIDGICAYMPHENPKYEAYMVFTGMPGKSIQNITLNNLKVVFYGGGSGEEARRIKIPELLDYTEYYFEARYFLGSLPAAGIYLRHIDGFKMTNAFLDAEHTDARPFIFANHLQNARFAGISGSGPAAGLIKTALCENVVFRDCDFNGSPVDYQDSSCGGPDKELAAYTEEALGVETEMAAWAADTDAAECSRLCAKLLPEMFKAEVSETAGYSVRFSTGLPENAESAKSRTWLYFPAVRGDIQISVNGRIIGIHKVPPEYQRKYSWAVDITAYPAGGELVIDIDMPALPDKQDGLKYREGKGKWFGLLLPPEIGREDGGNRETEGRVSPPPDIFGPL